MAAIIEAMAIRGISNRKVALAGSYTWAPKALKTMTESLSGINVEIVGDGLSIKQAPDADSLEACRELGRLLAK